MTFITLQFRTDKLDNFVPGPGHFFGTNLTTGTASGSENTSETGLKVNFPRIFGLANFLAILNAIYLPLALPSTASIDIMATCETFLCCFCF